MNCWSPDIICPDSPEDIILSNNIDINVTLFNPYSIYFKEFNSKRTISIIAGKLNKGECNLINKQYSFNFNNSSSTYSIDKNIEFKLNTSLNLEIKSAICNFNLLENNIF